jgi:transposase
VGLAAAAGLETWEAVGALDEQALRARLLSRGPRRAGVVMPDFARVHRELSRPGVTLMLLWHEYVAEHPGRTWGRTQFFEH